VLPPITVRFLLTRETAQSCRQAESYIIEHRLSPDTSHTIHISNLFTCHPSSLSTRNIQLSSMRRYPITAIQLNVRFAIRVSPTKCYRFRTQLHSQLASPLFSSVRVFEYGILYLCGYMGRICGSIPADTESHVYKVNMYDRVLDKGC
jgi:hypothetical protein